MKYKKYNSAPKVLFAVGFVAVGLMSASAPAFAISRAEAHLGPVTYTLTDLDLTDGVAPWLTFYDNPSDFTMASAAIYSDNYNSPTGEAQDSQRTDHVWESASAAVSTPASFASASLVNSTGLPGVNGVTLSAFGRSDINDEAFPQSNYWTSVSNTGDPWTPGVYGNFTLSPNTSVTFQAAASTSAYTFTPLPFPEGSYSSEGFVFGDIARASAYLVVSDASDHLDQSSSASSDISLMPNEAWAAATPQTLVDERLLTVQLTNRSAASLTGDLLTRVEVRGTSVSPVPEPATWALTLAGLGLLAGGARRKRNAD